MARNEEGRDAREQRRILSTLLNQNRLLQRQVNNQNRNNRPQGNNNQRNADRANEQIRRLNERSVSLNEELLRAIEEGNKDQEKILKDQLKATKDQIKANRDIARTSQEMNEHLDDLNDSVGTLNSNMSDIGSSFDGLRETINAFNIASISNKLTDDSQSMKDTVRELANQQGKDYKTLIKDMRSEYRASSKIFSNTFNSSEYAEMALAIREAGVTDQESINSMAGILTAMDKTLGVEMSSYNDLMYKAGVQSSEAIGNMLQYSKTLEGVSVDDILGNLNDASYMISDISKNSKISQDVLYKDLTNTLTTLQANDMGDVSDDIIAIINDSANGFKTVSEQMGDVGLKNIRTQAEAIQKGDFSSINETMTQMINDVASNRLVNYEQASQMYGNLISEDMYKRIQSGSVTAESYMNDLNKNMEGLGTGSLEEASNTTAKNTSWIEKIYNKISSSKLGGVAEGFLQSDLVETIGTPLMWSLAPKLVEKLFGSGGGTAGAGILSNLGTGASSLFSRASGGLSSLFGGATAGASASAGAGGLTALLGAVGRFASKALPIASLATSGVDSIMGIGQGINGETSQDRARGWTSAGMNLGGAGAGAAIGTFLFPGLGTLAGAGIGALVGKLGDMFLGDKIANKFSKEENILQEEKDNLSSNSSSLYDIVAKWYEEWRSPSVQAQSGYSYFNNSNTTPNYVNQSNATSPTIDGSHKTGLGNVPFDGYVAELHKNEAVLTAEDNKRWKAYETQNNTIDSNALNAHKLSAQISSKGLIDKAVADREAYANKVKMSSNPVSNQQSSLPQGSASLAGGDFLGKVSAKYEVSYPTHRGDFISNGATWGDPGGTSYGLPQFATNTGSAKSFARFMSSKESTNIGSLSPNTSAFNNAWKQLASSIGLNKFEKYQGEYAFQQFGKPFGDKWLQATGLSMKNRGFQEMLYSAGIQHGSGTAKKYSRGINSSMSDSAVVDKFYNNRATLNSTSGSVRSSLAKRFKSEAEDIKGLLNQSPAYRQGTPYVPEDQLALLHKGEAVIPKNSNPLGKNPTKTVTGGDNSDVVDAIKEFMTTFGKAIDFLASKMDETTNTTEVKVPSIRNSVNDRYRANQI